jgi:hypothetical protein
MMEFSFFLEMISLGGRGAATTLVFGQRRQRRILAPQAGVPGMEMSGDPSETGGGSP